MSTMTFVVSFEERLRRMLGVELRASLNRHIQNCVRYVWDDRSSSLVRHKQARQGGESDEIR
jgi:hypothetical protein